MYNLITQHKLPSVVGILKKAAEKIGGVTIGHDYTASCIFSKEHKTGIIDKIEDAILEIDIAIRIGVSNP